MVKVYLILKCNERRNVINAVNIGKQIYPEFLRFAFFVSFALPEFNEFFLLRLSVPYQS